MGATPKTCGKCGAPMRAGAARCEQCGKAVPGVGRVVMAIVAGVVVAVVAIVALRGRSSKQAPVNPRIVEVIRPSEGRTAFEVPEVLKVYYRDLGSVIDLRLQAKGNPALYVDVNQNGVAEEAVRYAASPDNSICVGRAVVGQDSSQCTMKSAATVSVERQESSANVLAWSAHWRIPKKELQNNADGVDFALQVFEGATQRGNFYPAAPFTKVYHLEFATGGTGGALPEKELPPAKMPEIGGGSSGATKGSSPVASPGNVAALPSVTRFEATPGSVERGETARLRWSVDGVGEVAIEPGLGRVAARGEAVVSPVQTTRYKLTARGAGGTASSEVSVAVAENAAPQIAVFQADPGTVQPEGTARLRWSVSGRTTSVKVDPGLDALPAQGERDVVVHGSTEFTLTATGPGGSTAAKVTVRAESVAPPPPSVRFDAEPSSIHQGESATLRWNATGTAQVTIEPGIGAAAVNGTMRVRPLNTTRYTLTATGARGVVATKDVTVTVERPLGPSSGVIVWTGTVNGVQLVTIDRDHVDVGSIRGALPGLPCIVQPTGARGVSIASAPGPRNNFERLILRVEGHGATRVVIAWSLQ